MRSWEVFTRGMYAAARRRWRLGAGVGAAGVLVLATAGTMGATSASAVSSSPSCSPTVTRQFIGTAYDSYAKRKLPVYRYTMTNCRGMQIEVLSYGGIVQSIEVPGRNGKKADVLLGFKTLNDYVKYASPAVTANGGPYFGELIGRFANRIAKGTFKLRQPSGVQTYTLPINNGVNSLHGGLIGFGNHVWASRAVRGRGYAGVQLTLISPNGDQRYPTGSPGCPDGCTGYPATLRDVTTYTLNNADQFAIHYRATNESRNLNTVLNLTFHGYFNLAGENAQPGSAYGQYIQINASKYSPTDSTQIPLGFNASVKGTPFDFTTPHLMGARIADVSAPTHAPAKYNQLLIAQGYDFNWVLNKQTPATTGPDGLNLAARAWDTSSGREMTVWTNQPGVQFYTSNFLNGTLTGISGHTYRQGMAYTFETQHYPNAPNQPNFPTTELKAGKTFTTTTIFQFSSNGHLP